MRNFIFNFEIKKEFLKWHRIMYITKNDLESFQLPADVLHRHIPRRYCSVRNGGSSWFLFFL